MSDQDSAFVEGMFCEFADMESQVYNAAWRLEMHIKHIKFLDHCMWSDEAMLKREWLGLKRRWRLWKMKTTGAS